MKNFETNLEIGDATETIPFRNIPILSKRQLYPKLLLPLQTLTLTISQPLPSLPPSPPPPLPPKRTDNPINPSTT